MMQSSSANLAAINEKLKLFKEMLTLSEEELSICCREQFDEDAINCLTEILNRRQALMDSIDQISASMGDLDKVVAVNNGAGGRNDEYLKQMDKMRSIIKQIQDNDKKCQQNAREAAGRIGDKIVSTRKNKKAFQAYTNTNIYNDAWFFDQKK
jgi:hypothetical protein